MEHQPLPTQDRLKNITLMLDHLLDQTVLLKQENAFLKHRMAELSQARAALVEKNRSATLHIKRIIQQLKEELQ
ncbi:MAG: hypothetical protein CMF51_05240 [Legionellales bacterium]|nr:hypothetical protein [Legionellales bacterium]|tara:strand:- start:601 stop:822 length:222 start_codon:yes stop_codon:yes gene_type:complete